MPVSSFLSDVGGLWLLASAIVVLVIALVFRKPIQHRIEHGGVKVKHRDTSLEITEKAEINEERPTEGEGEEAPPPREERETPLEQASVGGSETVRDEEGEAPADPSDKPAASLIDVVVLLQEGNINEAREVFDTLQSSGDDDEEQRRRREVMFTYWRYAITKDDEARADLERFAEEEPLRSAALRYLADAQRAAGFSDEAVATYEQAAEAAKSVDDRVAAAVGVALSLAAMGRREEALARLMAEVGSAPRAEKRRLLDQIAEIYREDGQWFMRALALEKALEESPDTPSRRFEIGYAYSQADREDLALLHYKAAVDLDPMSTTAVNNLGVAYERLEMPIRAVESYRRASDADVTLATANLANRLIRAGFIDEAREKLSEALTKPDVHPNVPRTLADADERSESEDQSERKAIADAANDRRFLRQYAAAHLAGEGPINLEGVWTNEATVEVSQDGAAITGNVVGADPPARWEGSVVNGSFSFKLLVREYTWVTGTMTERFVEKSKALGFVDDTGHMVVGFLDAKGDQRIESIERFERKTA